MTKQKETALVVVKDKYLLTQYNTLTTKVVDITVNDDTCFEVTDYTENIRKLIKYTKEKKKEAVVYLKQRVADTEKPYDDMITELTRLNDIFSPRLLEYHKVQREKERIRLENEKAEQERQLKEAMKVTTDKESKNNLKVAITTIQQTTVKGRSVVQSFGATSSIKDNTKYEITDLSKVPEEYCKREPDRGKIWAVVRTMDTQAKIDANPIAGIRIWLDEGLNLRQR